MRKTIATLAASAAILGGVVGTAQAKPGQYTRFSESTAANGAQQYAREHMGAAGTGVFDPGLKVTTDCLAVRFSASGFSSLWLCNVDTWQGRNTHLEHALIGVVRVDGRYEFRPYKVVPA